MSDKFKKKKEETEVKPAPTDGFHLTDDELVGMFPECEKIKKEDIRPIVAECFTLDTYHGIKKKILDFCNTLYPDTADWHQPWDKVDKTHYFYMYGDRDTASTSECVDGWANAVVDEYLHRKGFRRTKDEACVIAAEKWAEMIFGKHLQDNGDRTSHGANLNMMGSYVKMLYQKDLTGEMREKFVSVMAEFYKDDCNLEWADSGGHRRVDAIEPYCDYDPNLSLYEMLMKAGVPKDTAGCVCPWKTGVKVDSRDHSVIVRTYNTMEVI